MISIYLGLCARWRAVLRFKRFAAIAALIGVLSACSSSGPATTYYSLFSSKQLQASADQNTNTVTQPIGVGLVRLPGYLDNSSIVSISEGQKLNVSGYHAWAEPLAEAATRTMAGNLQRILPDTQVLAFPWDVRARPDLQLKIEISQFDGVRGDEVHIEARWSIYSYSKKTRVHSGYFELSSSLSSSDYGAYVSGLNTLLDAFSIAIAEQVSKAE